MIVNREVFFIFIFIRIPMEQCVSMGVCGDEDLVMLDVRRYPFEFEI